MQCQVDNATVDNATLPAWNEARCLSFSSHRCLSFSSHPVALFAFLPSPPPPLPPPPPPPPPLCVYVCLCVCVCVCVCVAVAERKGKGGRAGGWKGGRARGEGRNKPVCPALTLKPNEANVKPNEANVAAVATVIRVYTCEGEGGYSRERPDGAGL